MQLARSINTNTPDVEHDLSEEELMLALTETNDEIEAMEKDLDAMSRLYDNVTVIEETIKEHGMTPAMESLIGEAMAEYNNAELSREYSTEAAPILIAGAVVGVTLLAAKIISIIKGIIYELTRFHSKFTRLEAMVVDKFDQAMIRLDKDMEKAAWKGLPHITYVNISSLRVMHAISLIESQTTHIHHELSQDVWRLKKTINMDNFIKLVDGERRYKKRIAKATVRFNAQSGRQGIGEFIRSAKALQRNGRTLVGSMRHMRKSIKRVNLTQLDNRSPYDPKKMVKVVSRATRYTAITILKSYATHTKIINKKMRDIE